jgi:hypothetical protein
MLISSIEVEIDPDIESDRDDSDMPIVSSVSGVLTKR